MYQAWIRPGKKPRQQRAMLMRESAEQMPRLTHTARLYQRLSRPELHPAWSMLHRWLRELCGERGCCGRHSPAMGGKRMARKPKKISLPHMLFVRSRSEVLIRCLREREKGVESRLKAVASLPEALTPTDDARNARRSALLMRHTRQ